MVWIIIVIFWVLFFLVSIVYYINKRCEEKLRGRAKLLNCDERKINEFLAVALATEVRFLLSLDDEEFKEFLNKK